MFRDPQEESPSGVSHVLRRLLVEIDTQPADLITLSLDERVLVGRSDGDDTGSDLGLDLAAFGGDKTGVSRRHAVLSWQGDGAYIKDLDSTNGTRINGLKLSSNRSYRLHDGDEIELGSARLTVRFVRAPS